MSEVNELTSGEIAPFFKPKAALRLFCRNCIDSPFVSICWMLDRPKSILFCLVGDEIGEELDYQ